MKVRFLIGLLFTFFVFSLKALTLAIPSFPVESVIPDDYTFSSGNQCSGDNVSPQLVWSDVPDGTQSFAIVFIDENFNWLHWKLYNIDASVTHIPENNPNNVGVDGVSSFNLLGYGGPCPPSNTPGNYVFTVHALDTVFANEPSVSAINAATIESASYLAFRARNNSQVRYEYIAQYRLTFHAEWSAASHPVSFPGGAHFSELFGITHKTGGSIWKNSENASAGIESMAESGGTSQLSNEIINIINGSGGESTVDGVGSAATDVTSVEFMVSDSHPLISMVSMIAPSPDWFVGVYDLDLRENGLWREAFSVDLFPYDAGTDNGTDFTSPNSNTNPQQPIEQIITVPFANNIPLGRFEFELLSFEGEPSVDEIFVNGFE